MPTVSDKQKMLAYLNRAKENPSNLDERLDTFIQKALQSPDRVPDATIETTELAFCLEVLKVNVDEIKKKALKSAPLLVLGWVYEERYGEDVLSSLRLTSDTVARKEVGKGLFLEDILFSMEHASVDTIALRKKMWSLFIDKVSKGDDGSGLFVFPNGHVSMGIQQTIVRKRCGTTLQFSDETRLGNMVSDASDVRNNQVFNLDTKRLCGVVNNLNLLASSDTRKAIVKCVNTMNVHHPSTLGLSAPEYNTLRTKTNEFLRIVDTWESEIDAMDEETVVCGDSRECQTRIQRLQKLAEIIRSQATTCQRDIIHFRKRNVDRLKKLQNVKHGTGSRWF